MTSEKDTLACCLSPLDTVNFPSMNLHHYFCIGRQARCGGTCPRGTEKLSPYISLFPEATRHILFEWSMQMQSSLTNRQKFVILDCSRREMSLPIQTLMFQLVWDGDLQISSEYTSLRLLTMRIITGPLPIKPKHLHHLRFFQVVHSKHFQMT